jgi:hypothetical protein
MALLLNPRIWIALALAAFLSFTHFSAYRAGKAAVRADFDAYRLEASEALRKAQKEASDKEDAWQDKANQLEEAKDEQIRIIGDQLDTALASLRERPARPASGNVSKASGTCKGATGASLSRPDAEFLVRESARADRLRSALETCYARYEEIRR